MSLLHRNILLVDDDEDDQALFLDILNEIDSTVKIFVVNNGREALDYLKKDQESPTLIFLDLNMPLMNGFQCLVELKNNFLLQNIPVIIFTTSHNSNDITKATEMGASYFFTKPFDYRVFGKELRSVLDTDFKLKRK